MHEMGSVRELDRTLARTLMAEFARLQLIVGEDFTKSLIALHTDLEASCEALVSDIARTVDLHPDDAASCQVKAALQRFQQTTSLKVNLHLMELEAAREDMEEFMQSRLQEISSQTESRELIGEFSQKLADHTSRVRELVQVLELAEGELSLQVLIRLVAHQPLEANFFPGILEGLVGRLGLVPPGLTDPPTFVRTGMSRHWAATLREAVRRREGRDINLGQATSTVVPHGLHLDYDLDFQTRRVDDVAPTLTSPLLPGLVGNIHQLERPPIPGEPASFKADRDLWGSNRVPPKPDVPSPSHNEGKASKRPASEGEAHVSTGQREGPQEQPPSEPDLGEVTEIILSDEDEVTIQEPQGSSTPRSGWAQIWKRHLEDQIPHLSPSRKRATREEEKSIPCQEAALPTGMKEEGLLPKRYETFAMDHNWVQWVRGSLLGLEDGATPSQEDIDTSERFVPQTAASELDPPEVVADHWLPILWEHGLIAECHPDQFTALADWVPLYTPTGLQKHLPVALSAFVNTGLPCLTAVVPLEICVGLDREYLLTNFHRHECLIRQLISIGGRHRQLAFCPYCGVINENSETTLSHVRKHLNLLFVCGGCYAKSFPHGQALHKHMKTLCCSVSAIREKTRALRK